MSENLCPSSYESCVEDQFYSDSTGSASDSVSDSSDSVSVTVTVIESVSVTLWLSLTSNLIVKLPAVSKSRLVDFSVANKSLFSYQ